MTDLKFKFMGRPRMPADIETSNGIIHVIDTVVIPKLI